MLKQRWGVSFCFYISMLTACSTATHKFKSNAEQLGFKRQVVSGQPFQHVLYISPSKQPKTNILHVYIDGDGTPFLQNRYPAVDPTPRHPILLNLMHKDPQQSLYLGRPCYHQNTTQHDPLCHRANHRYWTNERYSPAIVKSLLFTLKHYVKINYAHDKPPTIVLIGFSGGGTLSMLLAPYLTDLTPSLTVITLAGNLDTEKWTKHHHYQPLTGSLNPANQPPLAKYIKQLHILGSNDKNVLLSMVTPVIKKQYNATFIPLANANHQCCWQAIFPTILDKLIFQ